MKFSVVITTYNRLEFLKRAIASALKQTIPCEVVIADDCSLDDTQSYVEGLQQQLNQGGDLRLVYYRSATNMGHAAMVNAGVERSSGDWIKFLDDDDYLAPNCLEEMAKAIALRPQAVIASCVAAQVNENEEELSRTTELGPGIAFYVPQADIHYGMLMEFLPFGTPVQVACSRDAFLQTGGWDSNLDTNCDDIDSWIRIAQFGDAIFLNQCLAYRTIWTGACNQKFSFFQRLDTNMLMKEKIYALVDAKHHGNIPTLEDTRNYLYLHWTLVAIRTKNIRHIREIINTSILSLQAWKLLIIANLVRRSHYRNLHLRKFVLID
ncbi:glycosyltransferase family 2 protein [Calothrix sp. UHCC 0171]|uniref:glycosyltransferase family 2 protein n=1 Tax=Calothrix sp. UHCC 0171 TaxID=3110245 RepID=UPI002B21126F|nr:glycosyltransferase family 2 protein [Calothrix sp. UHCC 0171]MEA5569754.1 glycosyltransferase family 2 protein [Calothrix sp. UHCC 0171]